MRKGQLEMMGLAVVVILISIAMLFAIRFVVLKEPAQYKKEYTNTQLAANMLSALLRTTINECTDLEFRELYKDCAKSYPDRGSITCDTSEDSCGYIKRKTGEILNSTLGKWHKDFEFNARTNAYSVFRIGGCTGAKKSKAFPTPVDPSGAVTLYVTLDICG